MKFIQEYKEQDFENSLDRSLYNKVGNLTEDEDKAFAKIVSSETTTRRFVKTFKNLLYDPYGIDSHREKYLDLKMKEVSNHTFNLYLEYLKTRNNSYITKAQRSFING